MCSFRWLNSGISCGSAISWHDPYGHLRRAIHASMCRERATSERFRSTAIATKRVSSAERLLGSS